MAVIGRLAVSVGMRTAEVTRGAQEMRGVFSQLDRSVSGSLSNLKASIGGTVAAALGLAGVGGSIGFGVKLAAEAESAEAAFGTLLQSVAKAKSVLAELSDFAAATPFELGELRQAARQLLAFGVAQQDLMRNMQTLGDLAAGTQKPILDFVDIFGKVKASGIASLADINRLADRGVPIYRLLAKEMGVTEGAIRGLAGQSKIGFEEIKAAMEAATSQGELFFKGMETASRTIEGKWSTLKDNLKASLKDIGQAMIDTFDFKGLIERSTELLQRYKAEIATLSRFAFDWGKTFLKVVVIVGALKTAIWAAAVAQKAYAAAAALASALSGPAGWAQLAVGVGLATAALVSINESWNEATAAMAETEAGAANVEKALGKVAETKSGLSSVADEMARIAKETETAAAVVERLQSPKEKLQGSVNEIRGLKGVNRLELEKRQVNESTGIFDKMREGRDEIREMRGEVTETGLELERMARIGAPAELIEGLRQILEARDALRKAKEKEKKDLEKIDERFRAAQGVIDFAKTDRQKFEERRAEILDLRSQGNISPEVFAAANVKLGGEELERLKAAKQRAFESSRPEQDRAAVGLRANSSEGVSALQDALRGSSDDPSKKTAAAAAQIQVINQQMLETLRTMQAIMKSGGKEVIVG